MLGNDISNNTPSRVLVNMEVFTVKVEEQVPFLKILKRTVEHEFFDKQALAQLWRYSENVGVVMEVFSVELTQKQVDAKLAWLDEQQAHPFRAAHSYPSLRTLAASLPYRPDIVGIVDLPKNGLWYGSKWIDLSRGF